MHNFIEKRWNYSIGDYSTLPIHTHRPKSHPRMLPIGRAGYCVDCCVCISLACMCKDVYLPGCEGADGILNIGTVVSLQMNSVLCWVLGLQIEILVMKNTKSVFWHHLNGSPGSEHKHFNFWKHSWWVQSLITWPSLLWSWALVAPWGAIWHL